MAFEFIKSELTEARMLRTEQNLPRTAETLINSLFLHVLTLEVLRHENPSAAKTYAKRTLQFPNFDKMRTSGTDLHNQMAIVNNKDMYYDKIAIPAESNLPLLQLRNYLRSIQNDRYDNGFTRQVLYKLQKFLNVTDAQLIAARRAVQDWPGLSKQEKQGALAILKKHYNLHSRRSDLNSDFLTMARKAGVKDEKEGLGLAKKAALAFGAGYALGRAIK